MRCEERLKQIVFKQLREVWRCASIGGEADVTGAANVTSVMWAARTRPVLNTILQVVHPRPAGMAHPVPIWLGASADFSTRSRRAGGRRPRAGGKSRRVGGRRSREGGRSFRVGDSPCLPGRSRRAGGRTHRVRGLKGLNVFGDETATEFPTVLIFIA